MALLFDNDDPDASQGFKNLKAAAADSDGGKIRIGIEKLCGAASNRTLIKQFIREFGRHVEERFWRCPLGVRVLEGCKALRKKQAAKGGARWSRVTIRKAAGTSGSR